MKRNCLSPPDSQAWRRCRRCMAGFEAILSLLKSGVWRQASIRHQSIPAFPGEDKEGDQAQAFSLGLQIADPRRKSMTSKRREQCENTGRPPGKELMKKSGRVVNVTLRGRNKCAGIASQLRIPLHSFFVSALAIIRSFDVDGWTVVDTDVTAARSQERPLMTDGTSDLRSYSPNGMACEELKS